MITTLIHSFGPTSQHCCLGISFQRMNFEGNIETTAVLLGSRSSSGDMRSLTSFYSMFLISKCFLRPYSLLKLFPVPFVMDSLIFNFMIPRYNFFILKFHKLCSEIHLSFLSFPPPLCLSCQHLSLTVVDLGQLYTFSKETLESRWEAQVEVGLAVFLTTVWSSWAISRAPSVFLLG